MATVTRDADAAALAPRGCGVGAHPARGGPAGARSAVPHPDPGWPLVEHPRAPLALLAASRFQPALRRNRVLGSRRGALLRRGAGCTPLEPAEVTMSTTRGHTPARREHLGPAEGLTRMTCLARIPPTNADHSSQSTGQCPFPSPAGPSVEHAVPRRISSRRPAGHQPPEMR